MADFGLFSNCVSEVVDQRFVGTVLTAQTAIGFLLTIFTIQGTPLLADAAGWPVAVAAFDLGLAAVEVAMFRLHRLMTARGIARRAEGATLGVRRVLHRRWARVESG